MIKKIIVALVYSSFLLGAENNVLDSFSNEVPKTDVSQFESLDKETDVSAFQHLNKPVSAIDQMNAMKNIYQGNDFLTSEEFNKVANIITQIKQMKKNGRQEYILYFTSTSVPDNTLFNVLFSVGILRDNGININAKHYFTGFPENFKEYMFALEDKVQNKSKEEIIKIKENFFLKIDPRMFYHLKIKEVPAIALAECDTENPVVEKCDFKYLIRGDVSLLNFFDKISNIEKKYQKYYDALKANKIISMEDYDEKK
jgi:hypothetical protein